MKFTTFQGGGGGMFGGSQSKQPTVLADNLHSKDRVEAIMGLCHGPIKGLTNGHKTFYVGDTPYQNVDGSYNFSLFDLDIKVGNTPGDTIYPVLGGYEDWRGNEVSLVANTATTFTTQASNCKFIVLRLNVRKLYSVGTDVQLSALPGMGNVQSTFLPHTATFSVEYKNSSALDSTYVNPFGADYTITGKTQTGEIHEIRFRIDNLTGPYTIRFTLKTPNVPTSPGVNGRYCEVQLLGYYEVTSGIFGTVKSKAVQGPANLAAAVPIVRTSDYGPVRKDGTYGIDYLSVRFYVQQLYYQDPSGNVGNSSINFMIEYKASSSNTWLKAHTATYVTITGKTTTGYSVSYRWPVTPIAGTYDLRVTRASPDVETGHTRIIVWESFQEIVGGSPKFDGVATAQVVGQTSDQLTNLPDLWGVYDLKLCRIPSNYDPYTRTYTGTWNGTFKIDWTSNPAWCLYDLITNDTYGAAAYWKDLTVDKFDFYNAGKYCDELVPSGRTNNKGEVITQPRYTCNGIIAAPRGIREQLRYMAGIFNGTFIDDLNGNVGLVWDRPTDAVAVFTAENVIGDFQYTYTDPSTRPNDITVRFNNPGLNYEVDTRRVYDQQAITRFGRVPLTFDAIMCTDAHEAVRRATYKLLTAQLEKEIVSFETNRQGLMLRPLDKILVGDPDMGYALTGRIKSLSASRKVVQFRDPLYLETGASYTFNTHYPNPLYDAVNYDNPLSVVSIGFSVTSTGQTMQITLLEALPAGVDSRAQFTIGAAGKVAGVPKPYRVVKVEEAQDSPDRITIEAIEIASQKYDLADNVQPVAALSYQNFPEEILPPTDLNVTTTIVSINGTNRVNVVLTWDRSKDPRVSRVYVEYRRSGDTDWIAISEVTGNRADLYDLPSGTYDFRIAAGTSGLNKSLWVMKANALAGNDVPPDDVGELVGTVQGDLLKLTWIPVNARNVDHYWLRYTPLVDETTTWNSATDLARVSGTSFGTTAVGGTYFVKAVNVNGVPSSTATKVVPMGVSASGLSLAHEKVESPTFSGTKINLTVGSGYLKNTSLDPAVLGSYVFETADLGASYLCRLDLEMVVGAEMNSVDMEDWVSLADLTSLSGVNAEDYYSLVYVYVSTDGATYGDALTFQSGNYVGRKFKFQIFLGANKPNVIPLISTLKSRIYMQNRNESARNVNVPVGGLNVTFAREFYTTPTIVVNVRDGTAGEYTTTTNNGKTGFTLFVKDDTGAALGTRNIDWFATGYGEK